MNAQCKRIFSCFWGKESNLIWVLVVLLMICGYRVWFYFLWYVYLAINFFLNLIDCYKLWDCLIINPPLTSIMMAQQMIIHSLITQNHHHFIITHPIHHHPNTILIIKTSSNTTKQLNLNYLLFQYKSTPFQKISQHHIQILLMISKNIFLFI